MLGTVGSFLATSLAYPKRTHRCRLTAERGDDLQVAVLEEVIYLVDTEAEAPVDLDMKGAHGGVDVTFPMVDASTLPQVGP